MRTLHIITAIFIVLSTGIIIVSGSLSHSSEITWDKGAIATIFDDRIQVEYKGKPAQGEPELTIDNKSSVSCLPVLTPDIEILPTGEYLVPGAGIGIPTTDLRLYTFEACGMKTNIDLTRYR